MATSSPQIAYAQRPDARPEAELSVLVAIYKLCLERSYVREKGRFLDKSGPEDARKDQDAGTRTRIPQ